MQKIHLIVNLLINGTLERFTRLVNRNKTVPRLMRFTIKEADVFLEEIENLTKKERSALARRIVSRYTNSKPVKSYKCGNYYWSASYTQGMIAVVISKNKVGIDIEKIVKKDLELFKISPRIRNWRTFYIVWTGIEAIIKTFNLNLRDYKKIVYQSHRGNKTTFLYDKKLIKIETLEQKGYCISICLKISSNTD